MARDPLRILQAVQSRSVEQARHALGACLKAESEAADRISSLDETTRRDREVSGAWVHAHQFLEMAAMRLEAARAERRIVEADLLAASARSEAARGVVTTARTAAEAVGQLIRERDAAADAETIKREQHVLDDIARRLGAARPRD
ncbi:MAG: hypothetical protein QOH05_685 [Acetobacteraceae bacterium]|jgi:hypothetical protein|nr:hypothetical protein [Acetobacteraceae bacterium]